MTRSTELGVPIWPRGCLLALLSSLLADVSAEPAASCVHAEAAGDKATKACSQHGQLSQQDEALAQNVFLLQNSMEVTARGSAIQGDVYDYIQELMDERAATEALRMTEQGTVDVTRAATVNLDQASLGEETSHRYFTTNTSSGETAAQLSGVAANSVGDLQVLLENFILNGAIIVACVLVLSVGRCISPMVYSFRDVEGKADGVFGWLRASASLNLDQIEEAAGLDMALLMVFCHLALKIMLVIGLPFLAILSPMDWFFGGNAAGQDHLSWLGMANVVHGSWVCWVHVPAVFWTVGVTQFFIFRTMDNTFMPRRKAWLMRLPRLRATTVLVENIPDGKNTVEGMESYFDDFVFGRKVVREVHMVKDTSDLLPLVREREKLTAGLSKLRTDPNEVLKVARLREVEREMSKLTGQAQGDDALNLSNAFVTFYHRREATICMKLLSPDDEEELEVTRAPDVQDVLWEDLLKDPTANSAREIIGMLLIIGVFFLFLPMVAGLSAITNIKTLADVLPFVQRFINKFPGIVNIWNGFVGAMALSIVMGLVPMFLALISYHFFILRAKSIVQHYIQDYYFKFSVVFVLLVTAIGSSLISTSQQLIRSPMSVFSLLASTMPTSTHFYMNYFAIQWSTHFINITRYVNLLKFAIYSRIYESLEAKSYSEPEDQVSYGIGARSAQWALLLTTGVVFGTLSPIMCLFAAINFAISRLVYGYLVVFAETRKTDLGGLFFVTQLRHVQQGEFIYVALMTGVLLQRSRTVVPGIVAACAFLPLLYTYNKFKKYRWEYMEFSEVKDYDQKLRDGEIPEVAFKGSPDAGPGAYKQPELLLVAPPKKEEPPGYTTILGLDCSKFVVNC